MTNPLLQEIETFLGRDDVRVTETGFGVAVMNDGKFIPDLRDGRRVWPETAEKVRNQMRDFDTATQTFPQQQTAAA